VMPSRPLEKVGAGEAGGVGGVAVALAMGLDARKHKPELKH
jgi:hypothetical protein